MRIRSSIFFWVFFATIVPLTVLALVATYYTEFSYQRDVTRSVHTSLENLASTIQRHLESNADLALGMSQAPAVTNFLPALYAITKNRNVPDINTRRSRINHFFEGFQTIIHGRFFLRILDINGNTLIKVGQQRSPAIYESLSGFNYVEQEIDAPEFVQQLRLLPANETSTLRLPHNQVNSQQILNFPLLDYVVPLYYEEVFVGALSITLIGEQLDRILDHATRLYNGSIFLAENNSDDNEQHGLVIYDGAHDLHIAQVRPKNIYVGDLYDAANILGHAVDVEEGHYQSNDGLYTHYFIEILPYPKKLVSWILTSRIRSTDISAPFIQIRTWIWAIAATALIISIALTSIGSRVVARPVTRLANNLKAFADGDHNNRVATHEAIDEIASLAEAFNYMADTLDKAQQERDRAQHMVLQSSKLASIGEMAAGIGHEINNPLNNILSYAKLISRSIAHNSDLLSSRDIQRLQQDLDSLRDEALRASDIVRGILNFGRQLPPHYSQFDIKTWLHDSLGLVQQAARQKHILLNYDYSGKQQLQGDRGQLQQALINLLLNAIQASPENSEVMVHARIDKDYLNIDIIDQGGGIAEQDMDRIFDPFFSTKPEGKGTGLGLSISLGIIEHHHGTLNLRNNSYPGTTASIVLPLSPEQHN